MADFCSCSVLQRLMLWAPTVTEELRNGLCSGSRSAESNPVTDVERDMVAATIVEQIRLCN
jgi:hypothetical protein